MVVRIDFFLRRKRVRARDTAGSACVYLLSLCLCVLPLLPGRAAAQEPQPDWQAQVRKYCDAKDWPSALHALEQQIVHAPRDLDLKAWHARVLAWSGNLVVAQQEYLAILNVSPNDPDYWAGLATVYSREGRYSEALVALDRAVQLDPKRADLRAAHARAMRDSGKRNASRAEFETALRFDPASAEARAGLHSLRGEPRNELRLGNEIDFLSYAAANQGSSANLATRWTPVLGTNFGFGEYHRGGVFAEKFVASATGRVPRLGAITGGGAIAHDRAVIPKSEAFFDLDRGWKIGEGTLFRGFELDYGQHWYWYQAARILTLNGSAVIYLPRDWQFLLAATGARSAFFRKRRGVAALRHHPAGISYGCLESIAALRKYFRRRRHRKFRQRRPNRQIRLANLRWWFALPLCRAARRHRRCFLPKKNAKPNGYLSRTELWNPFLKNFGGLARHPLC
jgi:Tfp pilus assembly protein PilF